MLSLDFAPILPYGAEADAEHLADVARTKRFLEYWTADPAFRAALPQDPVRVTAEAGLEGDALALQPLWEFDPEHEVHRREPHVSVARYRAFMAEKLNYRKVLRQGVPSSSPNFEAWRQRQVRRCFGELGAAKADALVHATVAVELCQGCSVGCWFCGISALKLAGVFAYPENRELWRGCLDGLHAAVGDAAGRGFLYWATDPLDNPDYERFCEDYADRLGRFPQTTTAQPLKDPARFRRLHALARRRGNEIDRFSVLTLGTLKKVFAEYTARELLHVELVMQMDGAWAGKAFAGKARAKPEKWRKSTGLDPQGPETASTIACVSGFLLRMPERSVELVTPCRADERWPNGYRVLARHTFADAPELAAQLLELTRSLPARVPLNQALQLRRDLAVALTPDGFVATGHYVRHEFKDRPYRAMRRLGEGLEEGRHTAMELALRVEEESPLEETLVVLNQLFAAGLLEEGP